MSTVKGVLFVFFALVSLAGIALGIAYLPWWFALAYGSAGCAGVWTAVASRPKVFTEELVASNRKEVLSVVVIAGIGWPWLITLPLFWEFDDADAPGSTWWARTDTYHWQHVPTFGWEGDRDE